MGRCRKNFADLWIFCTDDSGNYAFLLARSDHQFVGPHRPACSEIISYDWHSFCRSEASCADITTQRVLTHSDSWASCSDVSRQISQIFFSCADHGLTTYILLFCQSPRRGNTFLQAVPRKQVETAFRVCWRADSVAFSEEIDCAECLKKGGCMFTLALLGLETCCSGSSLRLFRSSWLTNVIDLKFCLSPTYWPRNPS